MAKKTRNYKAQNNKAINEFLSDIVWATSTGSQRSMQTIARKGIERLVNNVASFSDYTGVLINSYQAAIYQKGNFNFQGNGKYGGNFDAKGHAMRGYRDPYGNSLQNKFRNSSGNVILMTSHGVQGTTRISFNTVGRKGKQIQRRKQRNSRSKEFIRNYWKKRSPEYQGYGSRTGNIRAYSPRIKTGFEVLFDNPAPYALSVQSRNDGSRVMPVGVASMIDRGMAFTITTSEIVNALNRVKRKKGRK
jgi:hypothetical protein